MSGRDSVRYRLHQASQAIGRLSAGAPLPEAAEVTPERAVLCWTTAPGGGPQLTALIDREGDWEISENALTVMYETTSQDVGLSVVEAKLVPTRVVTTTPRRPVPSPAEVEAVLTGGVIDGDIDTSTIEGAEAAAQCDADTDTWDIPGVSGLSDRERGELRADR